MGRAFTAVRALTTTSPAREILGVSLVLYFLGSIAVLGAGAGVAVAAAGMFLSFFAVACMGIAARWKTGWYASAMRGVGIIGVVIGLMLAITVLAFDVSRLH